MNTLQQEPTQNESQLSADKLINLTLQDLESGEIDLARATVEIEYVIEQSLATALEEQRAEYVRRVNLLETHHKTIDDFTITSPMVYREDVLDILTQKKEDTHAE